MLECGVYYNNKTYKAGRSCIYRQDCREMIWRKRHLTPEGIEKVKRIKEETNYINLILNKNPIKSKNKILMI